mgnify:CR=1 FL=1
MKHFVGQDIWNFLLRAVGHIQRESFCIVSLHGTTPVCLHTDLIWFMSENQCFHTHLEKYCVGLQLAMMVMRRLNHLHWSDICKVKDMYENMFFFLDLVDIISKENYHKRRMPAPKYLDCNRGKVWLEKEFKFQKLEFTSNHF